MHKEVV